MDQWRVTVLGDGGVGKTALAVQVSCSLFPNLSQSLTNLIRIYSDSLLSTASLVSFLLHVAHEPQFSLSSLPTRPPALPSFTHLSPFFTAKRPLTHPFILAHQFSFRVNPSLT
jgi:hypothetical protein